MQVIEIRWPCALQFHASTVFDMVSALQIRRCKQHSTCTINESSAWHWKYLHCRYVCQNYKRALSVIERICTEQIRRYVLSWSCLVRIWMKYLHNTDIKIWMELSSRANWWRHIHCGITNYIMISIRSEWNFHPDGSFFHPEITKQSVGHVHIFRNSLINP